MASSPTYLSHPKYRPEIDGLRAIAVLSVVVFHAFPGWLDGGFIGVDVFYVISGFLISTIIFESLDRGTFSFAEFYARRIKRIFPALLLVLIASYGMGWCTLFADEYKQLGKHIAAGAGFVSNFALWGEAGYFDNSGETKPLLHLWSLGIEEQFYIVWPLLLWLAWKRKFNLLTITVLVALISFYLNVKEVREDGVAAFYSPQTRFWELLCGSSLAWLSLYRRTACVNFGLKLDGWLVKATYGKPREADGKTLANVLSLFGLLILAYGFCKIDKDVSFPGMWAAVPVLGAGLLIAAGPLSWVNCTVLSNRIAVWFGLISFPLYLWHWPLLSFARIIESGVPSEKTRIAAVLLSVVLAWLTYKLVETRIRLGGHGKAKVAALIVLMAMVGYAGYHTYSGDGFVFRKVVKINATFGTGSDGGDGGNLMHGCGIANDESEKLFAFCVQDKRAGIKYALIGDSKAAALFPGLVRTSTQGARWLFIGGPVPIFEDAAMKDLQGQSMAAVKALAENSSVEKVVVANGIRTLFEISDGVKAGNIATYDPKYLRKLQKTKNYNRVVMGLSEVASRLANAGKKVVFVIDNPALPGPQDCIARRTSSDLINRFLGKQNRDCFVSLKFFKEQTKIYRELLAELKSRYPDTVELFDPTEIYCDKDEGICGPVQNGRIYYSYTDHVSDYAAGLVGAKLNQFLKPN